MRQVIFLQKGTKKTKRWGRVVFTTNGPDGAREMVPRDGVPRRGDKVGVRRATEEQRLRPTDYALEPFFKCREAVAVGQVDF